MMEQKITPMQNLKMVLWVQEQIKRGTIEWDIIFGLRDWFLKYYHSERGGAGEGFKGEFTEAQRDASNEIIKAALSPNTTTEALEIAIEFSRQSGKTTTIVHTIEFLLVFYVHLTGKRLRVGIFAPQREQAKTDFDRLKEALEVVKEDFMLDFGEYNAQTIQVNHHGFAYVFPVTETSHPESKTLDLMIFEESHLINDKKMKFAVFPMGASTNAPRIFIGTAGYEMKYFYRLLQNPKVRRLIYPWQSIVAERRKLYERTGNIDLLKYEAYVTGERERLGPDSDEFKAPYELVWILGTGQFVTEPQLMKLYTTDFTLLKTDRKNPCYAGIDSAKNPDSTVVTVVRWNEEKKRKERIGLLELRGDNYQDQFDIIKAYLFGVTTINDKGEKVVNGGFNLKAVAIDSTGQGDFMPDMFEKHTSFDSEKNGLYRVKFSLPTKDVLYKGLQVVIHNQLTLLPKGDNIKEEQKFVQQMLDLQKEYRGELLRVNHPDEKDAHDDYSDSWALAEFAYTKEQEKPKPNIRFI